MDASIQSDDEFCCLAVLCASCFAPEKASALFQKTLPRAIIEQFGYDKIKPADSASAPSYFPSNIPYQRSLGVLDASRDILVTLLLEYRCLMQQGRAETPKPSTPKQRYSLSCLFFEQAGTLCAVPEFQVMAVQQAGTQKKLVFKEEYGGKTLLCSDLLYVSSIDIVTLVIRGKATVPGFFESSSPDCSSNSVFNFVVPSFL